MNIESPNVRNSASQKGIMEENILDQSPPTHLNKRPRLKDLLCLLALTLFLSLALNSHLLLNYLAPDGPGRIQGVSARVSWYLQSGQSRADVRTLASAIRFMMGTESDTGTVDNYSTLPVARNASPTSLKT